MTLNTSAASFSNSIASQTCFLYSPVGLAHSLEEAEKMAEDITYSVAYGDVDPFKILAQGYAHQTNNNAAWAGFKVLPWSRGESVTLLQCATAIFGHLEEGLGTKVLIADAMRLIAGSNYYHSIAQDTAAMIINDMITLGVLPVSLAMHLAVGDSTWLLDRERVASLVAGWKDACDTASCIWSGGETPVLKDIVHPNTAVLSGSGFGILPGTAPFNPANIQAGDKIVFLESSGIHANGLTLAREIADKLPDGYLTRVYGDNRSFGEALLAPTHIYAPVIARCIQAGIDIHYAVNITGHGWRKLMRAPQSWTYVVDTLPPGQPIFQFIQEKGPVNDREAYATLNMGAGFALIVAPGEEMKITKVFQDEVEISGGWPFNMIVAGHIEEGEKHVVIEPKGIEFKADTLAIR